MRSVRDVERAVGQAKVHSRPDVNQAVLDSLLEELAAVKQGRAVSAGPHPWMNVVRNPMTSAVAAAAILAILVLLGVPRTPHRTTEPQALVRSPAAADLLTVGHLNMAHRRGGLDELNRQYDQAAQRLGSPPERISVEELIQELKGS